MSAGLATDSAGRARGNVPVAVPVPGGGGGGFVCGPYCGGVVGCVGVYSLLRDITGCASAGGGCWFMVSGERGYIILWMGSHLDSLADAWTIAAAAARMKVVRIFIFCMDKGARLLVEIFKYRLVPARNT